MFVPLPKYCRLTNSWFTVPEGMIERVYFRRAFAANA